MIRTHTHTHIPVVGQEIITTSQHSPLLESNKHSNKKGISVCLDYHSSIQQMLKVHHLGSRHTAGPEDFAPTSIWPLPSRGSLSERKQLHKEMAAEPSLQSTVSTTQKSMGLPVPFRAFGETARLPGTPCHSLTPS